MPQAKQIKVHFGYTKMTPTDVVNASQLVQTGLTNNSHAELQNPPVPIPDLKLKTDAYAAAILAAQDGSKKAIVERDRLGEIVIKDLYQLGHWVEAVSNNNMSVFLSSGFTPKSTAHATAKQLDQPTILGIEQGVTGELKVTLSPRQKALVLELQEGIVTGGVPPTSWTKITITQGRGPVSVTGLTPGTVYGFQVRAIGKAGATDWSPIVTRMCI